MNPQHVCDHGTLYFHLLYYLWITMSSVTNSFGIHRCPSLKQILKQFLTHYHPSRRKDFEFTENGFWNCFLNSMLSFFKRKVLKLFLNSFLFCFSEKVFEKVFVSIIVLGGEEIFETVFKFTVVLLSDRFLKEFLIYCCSSSSKVFESTAVLVWDGFLKVFFNLLT